MSEELYNELKEIEDRLYIIASDNDALIDSKLGDTWNSLYLYLKEVKPIKL